MPVDALGTERHFVDHIYPVWQALPARGTFYSGCAKCVKGSGPIIVASYGDLFRVKDRAAILMEHGAGQTYRPNHRAYAGGPKREHVGLFLSPSERVAELNRRQYPSAAHAVIGCPLLDKWIGHKPDNPEPTVAFAFHWDAFTVAPEARSAFGYYSDVIPKLPYKLLGHGHPKAMRRLRFYYQKHGIEIVESYAEILRRADVLVFDNTSAGYMFAATGRPVVVLDAPWYKTAWGGRFWDWADVGVRISDPSRLAWAIEEALADKPEQAQRRADISAQIYAHLDGTAASRAAGAIMNWLDERAAVAA